MSVPRAIPSTSNASNASNSDERPDDQTDIYTDVLRQAGYRITAQRRAICDYLGKTSSHPTPYQVYSDMSSEDPDISRATVYNTLKVLQNLGAIVEIAFGSSHTHYDTNPAPHVNLICLRCHEISDFHDDLSLDGLRQSVAQETGFQTVSARIDLIGFCSECRERKIDEIRHQWQEQHQSAKEKKS